MDKPHGWRSEPDLPAQTFLLACGNQHRAVALRSLVTAQFPQSVVAFVETPEQASRLLRDGQWQGLLIDLSGYQSHDWLRLQRLAATHQSSRSVPWLGLAEEALPLEITAALDGVLDGVLPLAAQAEWSTSGAFRPRLRGGDRLPEPRTMLGRTVGLSTFMPDLAETIDQLQTVCRHDVTILLVGETGSGKTSLARLLHELSPRRDERFMALACGALPEELIESELFGHVKGAFTGADRTKFGRFDVTERGTLLLDEIDVLEPRNQVKLLRVVESGEFEPVGSSETRRSDARLIVASNVDLRTLVERDGFRADLYYRLSVMEFHLPPLRQRPHDLIPLAADLIEECAREHQVEIRRVHPEFLEALRGYHWPGNVRELKNHLRRAVLFCQRGELTPRDLSAVLRPKRSLARIDQAQPEPPVTAEPFAPAQIGLLPCLPLPQLTAADVRFADHPPAAGPLPQGEPLPPGQPFVTVEAPPMPTAGLAQRVRTSEREMLISALQAHQFRRSDTAAALGISRVGLYKKLKKHGLQSLGRDEDDEPAPRLPR